TPTTPAVRRGRAIRHHERRPGDLAQGDIGAAVRGDGDARALSWREVSGRADRVAGAQALDFSIIYVRREAVLPPDCHRMLRPSQPRSAALIASAALRSSLSNKWA